MPEDKLSSVSGINITVPSTSSETALATTASIAETSKSSTDLLMTRYKMTQELITQLSIMQGRLPPEVDKKLQAFLQQINVEQQSLRDTLNNTQIASQEKEPYSSPQTPDQPMLRQLSNLLSLQPTASLPSVIKSDLSTKVTPDTIYSTLVPLLQHQPAEWMPESQLGKSVLNWLVQSQLALTPEYWQRLPQQPKNQLLQIGTLPPENPISPPQRQFIQQITSQIFNFLIQQKNLPTKNPIQTTLAPNLTQYAVDPILTNNTQILPKNNTDNKIFIDVALSKFIQELPLDTNQLPSQVKDLVQQMRHVLQQVQTLEMGHESTPIAKSVIDSNKTISTEIKINTNNTQIALTSLLSSVSQSKPMTVEILKNAISDASSFEVKNSQALSKIEINQQPIEPKINNLWTRWIIQLSVPKIMLSPELLAQVKTSLEQKIWLPQNHNEFLQQKDVMDSIQRSTISFIQTVTQAQAPSPSISNDTINTIDTPKNEIQAVEAINRDIKGTNTVALQQLLTSLRQMHPILGLPTTEKFPETLTPPVDSLIDQFTSSLLTGDNIRSWMQFLLQPLDSDNNYAKTMQQWLLQLLQHRMKASQQLHQASDDSKDPIHSKDQLNSLTKLANQSLESIRSPAQPTNQNNGLVPSLLQLPLPPQQNSEEPGSFTLQRNTREDNERGWNISLYLEPAKLGPIRFQARIALPEITISIVAEKPTTVDLIKETYPKLEQRFQILGLIPQTLQIRQGKTKRDLPTSATAQGFSIKV